MTSKIYTNTWSSVVVFCNQLISEMKLLDPDTTVAFIDWENHANIEELPDSDLMGPTALTITDYGEEGVEVNFAIAVSTDEGDTGLFRHRAMGALVFEAMRPLQQFKYYDTGLSSEKSVFVFAPGTLLAPMSRAATRPWQYVQASALLVPSET